jgi:hypothetical protein
MVANRKINTPHCNGMYKTQTQIKCTQINLQHFRVATTNVIKITEVDSTDILCIQPPYTVQNKTAAIPKTYKSFTSGEGTNRAANVVTNNQSHTLLIKQLSDTDTVILEIIIGSLKIILASMYFNIGKQIEMDLMKTEAAIQHAKGAGVLIAMDSNSTSTLWHNSQKNKRGRILEEFIICKQLYIMNSVNTTFWNGQWASNVDLTPIGKRLLRTVVEWEISKQGSCSDQASSNM